MLPYDRVWATPLNVYEQTLAAPGGPGHTPSGGRQNYL